MIDFLMISVSTFLVVVMWMAFYRYLDFFEQESWHVYAAGILIGTFTIVPVILLESLFLRVPEWNVFLMLRGTVANELSFLSIFYLFVSFFEEGVKAVGFLVLVWMYRRHFSQVVDGILYGALIALGFSFIENVHYFWQAFGAFAWSANYLAIFVIRSFGTMLSHTVFTGIFGLYFAKAYFLPFLPQKEQKKFVFKRKGIVKMVRFPLVFFMLLPEGKRISRRKLRMIMILQGYLIAVALHFAFNLLLKLDSYSPLLILFTIPLILFSSVFIWRKYFVPLYVRIIRFKILS